MQGRSPRRRSWQSWRRGGHPPLLRQNTRRQVYQLEKVSGGSQVLRTPDNIAISCTFSNKSALRRVRRSALDSAATHLITPSHATDDSIEEVQPSLNHSGKHLYSGKLYRVNSDASVRPLQRSQLWKSAVFSV